VYVERSSGSPDRREAEKARRRIEEEIERGELSGRREATFASAMTAYIAAGGEERFLDPLLERFGHTRLSEIDQAAIDAAAAGLYPDAGPATRNRQVYTPVQAVLRHAGVTILLRRPKGAQGRQRVEWLWPEQAGRLLQAAADVDPEFGLFCAFLLYTGCRRGEAEGLLCDATSLADAFGWVPTTKNGDPRGVHLPPVLVAAMANHPRGMDRSGEPVFRPLHPQTRYSQLYRARARAGADLAAVTFHTLRHTWATWMRRYGGLDIDGLIGTGTWRDRKSAGRYTHVVASEESMRADRLPALEIRGKSGDTPAQKTKRRAKS